MLDTIRQQILQSLKEIGVEGEINFSLPPDPDMGDLCFSCFELAKLQKKNPAELATEIIGKFHFVKREESELIKDLHVAGPYVNIIFNPTVLAELVLSAVDQENFGANQIGAGKKVIIEYPSQNTHKEFHIGHLRNVCIGNSLVGLMEKSNFKVFPVNYINDFGSHVVKCLWYLEKTKDPRIETHFLLKNKQK